MGNSFYLLLHKATGEQEMILDEQNAKVAKQTYIDLKNIYIKEAMEKFAKEINLQSQELLNVETNKTIPSEIGKKLRNLMIIKSGSVHFPAPKPELEPIVSDLIAEAQQQLIDLNSKIDIAEIAQELKTTPDRLQDFLQNKKLIPKDIAIKLRYLWAIKLGTSYHPAPASVLDEPEEYSIFDIIFKLVANDETYKVSNLKDIFPRKIKDSHYDGALLRVTPKINDILSNFFKGNFDLEMSKGLSIGEISNNPGFRKFELEILYKDEPQYIFVYGIGIIIKVIGNLPDEKIAAVLRQEAKWEV